MKKYAKYLTTQLIDIQSLMIFMLKKLAKSNNISNFVLTVPVLHTIRTADGSFFFYSYGK